jgi:hypothetical protein
MGSNGVELDVVFHLFSGSLEEISKELREGENRGPEVEGEAVFFEKVEFSSDFLVLFKDFDLIAGSSK